MKRKRRLQPDDYECRALATYARTAGVLPPCLSAIFELLPDSRKIVVIRSRGEPIKAFQVMPGYIRRIPLELW